MKRHQDILSIMDHSRDRMQQDTSPSPDKDITWASNIKTISDALQGVVITDQESRLMPDNAFNLCCTMVQWIREQGHTIFFVGNGASATMASHLAADMDKNAHVDTRLFTDQALITAVANDISFDQVFSYPLERRMIPGDLLVAISSSGNSPNIVNACKKARELGGSIITLTGMNANNEARKLGDLNFWVPADSYGTVESCHGTILHHWMDKVALRYTPDAD